MAPFLKILLMMSRNHVPSFMLLSQNAGFLHESALLLVQFITANSTQFQEYHNEGKIEAHASRMSNLCVWGTSVELYSAATLFKTDIYVLSKQPNSPQYKWLCYHPLPMSRFSIHEPDLVEKVASN